MFSPGRPRRGSAGHRISLLQHQRRIPGIPNLLLGSIQQRLANPRRGVLNAEKVARNLSLRRQHHDSGGVDEFVDVRNVLEAKSHRLGQSVNRGLITHEKMPGLPRARPPIKIRIKVPLGQGHFRPVLGIKAHR